jgi:hypothetical protein
MHVTMSIPIGLYPKLDLWTANKQLLGSEVSDITTWKATLNGSLSSKADTRQWSLGCFVSLARLKGSYGGCLLHLQNSRFSRLALPLWSWWCVFILPSNLYIIDPMAGMYMTYRFVAYIFSYIVYCMLRKYPDSSYDPNITCNAKFSTYET